MSKNTNTKELFVKRNKNNMVTIGFRGSDRVQIFPGLNRITDEKILKLIDDAEVNKTWLAFINNGTHEIVSGKTPSSKSTTSVFTAMASDNAIDMVKNTYSIPALEKMYSDEESKKSRKSVLTAIQAQIEEMKTPDTKEKANTEN